MNRPARPEPYGSWPSPITAERIAAGGVRLSQPRIADGGVYWLENRPAENGRGVVVRARPDEAPRDLTPAPFSVRSRVHEYGGGAFVVGDGALFFVNHEDQQIYRQTLDGGAPQRLSHAPHCRFADLLLDAHRQRLICVSEVHAAGERAPANQLIAVDLRGGRIRVLAEGRDFYSSPALSPDGRQLAWLCWNAPAMPWDGCELWLAGLDDAGAPVEARWLAGSGQESIFEPQFAPDGSLHFISDRSGFWNIYKYVDGEVRALTADAMDYAYAQWNLGMSSYGFLADGTMLATRIREGVSELVRIDTQGQVRTVDTGCTQIEHLQVGGLRCTLLAGSPAQAPRVLLGENGQFQALTPAQNHVPAELVSRPQCLRFPTGEGEFAYAWYYAPRNPECAAAPGEKPPLLVKCHGGPTAMSGDALDTRIQFWTSRGFAVADVNYRGSSGFGRAYRQSLHGHWGIKDAEDCVVAAQHLVERGLADRQRLAISGSSAGGFTALCALAFHDYFRAGAVYYGLSELASAMRDTHKFEAHYGDSLLGPWPAARAVYRARSPLYAAGRINCPVIFFQGLQDKIVPPDQTERMVQALRDNSVPAEYLSFAEEGHGFRRRETLQRTLEAELAFYGRVFGFSPA